MKTTESVALPIDVAPLVVPVMMRRAGITGPNTDKNRSCFDRSGRECNVREEPNGDLKVSVRGTNQKEEAARNQYHKLRLAVANAGQAARQARAHYEKTKDNSTDELAKMRLETAKTAEAKWERLTEEVAELEKAHPVLVHDQLTSEAATLASSLPRMESAIERAKENLAAWQERQSKEREPDDKTAAAIEASEQEIEGLKRQLKETKAEIEAIEKRIPETGYTPGEPEVYVVPFGSPVTFTP